MLPQAELDHIELNLLLEGIFAAYGHDYRHYTRTYLMRRVMNRMRLDKLASISSLLEKVLYEPAYLHKVIHDFSIKVTEMFRDPSFFKGFRQQVVPHLKAYPDIRIWHAGCATGEEVYSMAILMHEAGLADKTRIYATDLSEEAIQQAKLGVIPLKRMQAYTKNYIDAGGTRAFSEYYRTDSQHAFFHPHLKSNLTFAQHNLATDGSFNEFHAIICRNVLIYFNPMLQSRVHELFYNSLCPLGFLGLGSKESLMTADNISRYHPLIAPDKIFRKKV